MTLRDELYAIGAYDDTDDNDDDRKEGHGEAQGTAVRTPRA